MKPFTTGNKTWPESQNMEVLQWLVNQTLECKQTFIQQFMFDLTQSITYKQYISKRSCINHVKWSNATEIAKLNKGFWNQRLMVLYMQSSRAVQ